MLLPHGNAQKPFQFGKNPNKEMLCLFVLTTMSVDAESTAMEHFVAQVWSGDITDDYNYTRVAKAFVDWWYNSNA